jgi:hypothetical protein
MIVRYSTHTYVDSYVRVSVMNLHLYVVAQTRNIFYLGPINFGHFEII